MSYALRKKDAPTVIAAPEPAGPTQEEINNEALEVWVGDQVKAGLTRPQALAKFEKWERAQYRNKPRDREDVGAHLDTINYDPTAIDTGQFDISYGTGEDDDIQPVSSTGVVPVDADGKALADITVGAIGTEDTAVGYIGTQSIDSVVSVDEETGISTDVAATNIAAGTISDQMGVDADGNPIKTGDYVAPTIGGVDTALPSYTADAVTSIVAPTDEQKITVGNVTAGDAATITEDSSATSIKAKQLAYLASLQEPGAQSAEQIGLARDRDAAIAQQVALSKGRGADVSIAQRQLASQVGKIGSQAAEQSAMLGAQQAFDRKKLLGESLGSARTVEAGLATSQAGLTQQSILAGKEFERTQKIKDAEMAQTLGLTLLQYEQQKNVEDARLATQAGLTIVEFKERRKIRQAELQQQAGIKRMEVASQRNLQQGVLNFEASRDKSRFQLEADLQQQRLEQQRSTRLAELAQESELQGHVTEANRLRQQADISANRANLLSELAQQRNIQDSQNNLRTHIQNQSTQLQLQGMSEQQALNKVNLNLKKLGISAELMNVEQARIFQEKMARLQHKWDRSQSNRNNQNSLLGGVLQGAGLVASAYVKYQMGIPPTTPTPV